MSMFFSIFVFSLSSLFSFLHKLEETALIPIVNHDFYLPGSATKINGPDKTGIFESKYTYSINLYFIRC